MEKTDQILGSTQTTETSRGEDGEVSGDQEHTDGLHGHLGDVANFASLSGSAGEESINEPYRPTDHEARYDERQDSGVGNDGNDIPPESTGLNSLGYSAERENQLVANVKTHQIGSICARRFLPPEQAGRIRENLEKIDRITEEKTVEALNAKGALPPSFKSTENSLIAEGINPNLLTIEEAEQLDDYVGDKTPEARKRKIKEIIDSIHRMRNTTRSRRSFEGSHLGGKFDQLATLADMYEKGEFNDPEGNFDVYRYLVSRYSANDYREIDYSTGREFDGDYDGGYDGWYSKASYHSLFKDAGVQSGLERAIEDGATIDDLINEDLISEDQIPVMGPFTAQDLEGVEVFQKLLWAEPDTRTDKEVRDLLSTTVKGVGGLQEQLTQRYIAEEFLPKRRLGPKNLLLLTASMGKDYFRLLESIPEDEAKIIKEKLSYASLYLGKAMLVSGSRIKETYGSIRPVTEKFFDDVIGYANSLSESRESILNQDINAYLAKLDKWVFEIEALLEPYAKKENGEKSEASDQFGLPSRLNIGEGE